MRKFFLLSWLFAACLLCLPTVSLAEEVEVFTVREEEMSPMELRNRALAEGFAVAVTREAQAILGGAIDEFRLEAVQSYFVARGKAYIQGYNILSSQETEDGLDMRLDVRVNRRTLRAGLTKLGFFETVQAKQPVTVVWPEDITEEDMATLMSLMTMSGLEQAVSVHPSFVLEYGPEKTYRGRLVLEDKEWLSADKDMGVVWTNLWTRFFSRPKEGVVEAGRQTLTVAGWFTPDGVLEFDRVLKSWDAAVEETRLVAMNIQPTGVGATWDMRILNPKRLGTLLNAFLPQRGLSFQLNRESEE